MPAAFEALPDETDAALLEAARAMNRTALTRIFDLYSTPLYRYALRLGHDPLLADQIVGDVFAKFLEQSAAGRGPTTHLRSYLYQMAYHLMIDEARYSGRRAPVEQLDLHQHEKAAAEGSEERQLLERVVNAIQTALTADQRHVIILRFLEDMSLKETAGILGKSVNHIKVIQNRAIASLRKVIISLEE